MAQLTRPKNNGTPQAVGDLLVLENPLVYTGTDVIIGTVEELLANDKGGDAKTFYGLVGADENGVVEVTDDGTLVGIIKIDGDGNIVFTPTEEFDTTTLEFDYEIQLGNGVLSSATVEFEVAGEDPFQTVIVDFDEYQLVSPVGEVVVGYEEDGFSLGTPSERPFAGSRGPIAIGDPIIGITEANAIQDGQSGYVPNGLVGGTVVRRVDGGDFIFTGGLFLAFDDITLLGYQDGTLVESYFAPGGSTSQFVSSGWTELLDELFIYSGNLLPPSDSVALGGFLRYDDLTFEVA